MAPDSLNASPLLNESSPLPQSKIQNPKSKIPPPVHPRLGIPELGGVCRYEEVGAPGFDVEENVALLKRYNWIETRLTDLFLTQLTATPEWEIKDAFSLHVWLRS